MPRKPKKPRRLVAAGRVYLWTLRHNHHGLDGGGTGCRETLTLYPQPVGTGGPLRIVFAEGPGHYIPGGFLSGSGDVGDVRSGCVNLHEPGVVRALLDAASARGWQPAKRWVAEVDGWPLLEAATARGVELRGGQGGVLLVPLIGAMRTGPSPPARPPPTPHRWYLSKAR
ncbi:hypothetical protein AB0I22_39250 [Streptomyces sp. NPDC050610]|uniref:hypothetical protein n=1 Tax=Streptomyces sp. NPDC050610 TaxID=3157097 RepID=UPI00343AE66B